MAVTTVDIANRALQMVGLQKKLTSLTQDSAEAQAVSVTLDPIERWCFGLENWNFARVTATLSQTKVITPPVTTWTNTAPALPWTHEYSLPSDFVRALYVTNSAAAADTNSYAGEPQRFVIASGVVSATQQPVLLTNQTGAILVYTGFVSDPTVWPWYFERLAVVALAQAICVQLTSNMAMFQELTMKLEQQISISIQLNRSEGLYPGDATPEWIQALGINYPFRRFDAAAPWQSGGGATGQPGADPGPPGRPVGPQRRPR